MVALGFEQPWRQLYQQEFKGIDWIIPIPLSPDRLYERSFNQTELLAHLLGTSVTPALFRIKNETKQSQKGRMERLERTISPFLLDSQYQTEIENRNILLIDDIYTTGTTLRWAAKTLKDSGAGKVFGMTLAHG